MIRPIDKKFEKSRQQCWHRDKKLSERSEFFLSVAGDAVAFSCFLSSILIFASLHQGKDEKDCVFVNG